MYYIGLITHPKIDDAKILAGKLVESKLVACVNIVPQILSIYRWKGKIEEDNECLMIVKTTREKSEEVIEFVKKNHPYDTPEIIFTDIKGGLQDYLTWIGDSTKK